MNLLALRTEVINHGFDPIQYSARITQWINDAYDMACRRVNFYVEETTQTIATVQGTATYTWPADFGRMRSLYDTDRQLELERVNLRQIDVSPTSQGTPNYYAMDAMTVHVYPVPDGVHNLVLRYWKVPSPLVADTDVPVIPGNWQRVLWYWACKEAYAADDDPQSAQYWETQYNMVLSEFQADVKFPDTNYPVRAAGMWGEDDQPLTGRRAYLW